MHFLLLIAVHVLHQAPRDAFGFQGCNIYEEVETSVKASHGASDHSKDDNLGTSWVAQANGRSWLEYRITARAPDPARTSELIGLRVLNGSYRSTRDWKEHGRARSVRILVDGTVKGDAELRDSMLPQQVDLPLMLSHSAPTVIRLEVTSVWPGVRYDDVAIAEVMLDGPQHSH